MTVVRVVVVDDEPMVCAHLRTILGSSGTIEVVGEAHDGAAGVEEVVRTRPDLVLMDLRMPGVDGLTAIERIGKMADPPAVVVLTTFDADQYVLRALRAGAAGFLVKSTPPEDLIGLVQVAAEGHTVLSPVAARRLVAASADSHSARDRARGLRVPGAGQAGLRQPHPGRADRPRRGPGQRIAGGSAGPPGPRRDALTPAETPNSTAPQGPATHTGHG
jgi:DNA-binding NarL/FixJ family response regulator